LTIPFLLGALRQPIGSSFGGSTEAFDALVILLEKFSEVPEFGQVAVRMCGDIHQPVASLTIWHWQPSYLEWGVQRPDGGLILDAPYRGSDPHDLKSAAGLLWEPVGAPIGEGKFSYSRDSKSYLSFGANDLQFIDDALTFNEDDQL
jgi:hypothetical protein